MTYKEFCFSEYKTIFETIFVSLKSTNLNDKRRDAQKIAIREASIKAIRRFPGVEPSDIWKTVYTAHIYNVSKVSDDAIIQSIISADNSWKKSSGHAFEEMIKELGNLSLKNHDIEIILQKDLHYLLHTKVVTNEVRDISWLNEQIRSSAFDLYLAIKKNNTYQVFGCIQSKTSIRDRVTRDREPSMIAMKAYFMSVAIVLDGDFLKMPKFKSMVNGGSADYELNGWHGMYVLSNKSLDLDRIFSIDITMKKFVEHVVEGAESWQRQRQWFDNTWRPKEIK